MFGWYKIIFAKQQFQCKKKNFDQSQKKVHTHISQYFVHFFCQMAIGQVRKHSMELFYAVLQNLFTTEKKEEEEKKLLLRFIFTISIGNECACCCCCCCCSFSSYRFVVCILSTSDSNFSFFSCYFTLQIYKFEIKRKLF